MPGHFKAFSSAELTSAGVLIVSQNLEIRQATSTKVLLVWAASDADEWRNRIAYLPL